MCCSRGVRARVRALTRDCGGRTVSVTEGASVMAARVSRQHSSMSSASRSWSPSLIRPCPLSTERARSRYTGNAACDTWVRAQQTRAASISTPEIPSSPSPSRCLLHWHACADLHAVTPFNLNSITAWSGKRHGCWPLGLVQDDSDFNEAKDRAETLTQQQRRHLQQAALRLRGLRAARSQHVELAQAQLPEAQPRRGAGDGARERPRHARVDNAHQLRHDLRGRARAGCSKRMEHS